MPASALTAANLSKLGTGPREEQEDQLYSELLGLSQLLGKVNAALDEEGSTRPPTGASTRPRTGNFAPSAARPATGGTAIPPSTAASGVQRAAATSAATSAAGAAPQVQMVTFPEEERPASDRSQRIELVNYTGMQSNTAGISTRRKIDARAARSEMSSILFGS